MLKLTNPGLKGNDVVFHHWAHTYFEGPNILDFTNGKTQKLNLTGIVISRQA